MAKKLTKTQMFNKIKAQLTDADEIAFIEHEIELVTKKNAAKSDKPTKKQVANSEIKDELFAAMEEGKPYTIGDMLKLIPCVADLTNQKVSALVRQLKEDGKVERTEVKRVAYFTKVADEDEAAE